MGATVIFVFVMAITAQSIYSHVGLSREGVIEQDQNPEHTSNIEVDINKENSAKASPVSGSHFYHGLSNFGVGENIKVEQQSEVEVKFHKKRHPAKHCSVSCYC
ncbi:GSCOCG00006112001-RA-CDS, partial [Cotesia congregata]